MALNHSVEFSSRLVFEIERSGKRDSRPHDAGTLGAMDQSGKQIEFARLVQEQVDPTTRLALRLTGDWHRAEELVQETMLRAARSRDSFRGEAAFKTWLYRILINVFRDRIRRKSTLNFENVPPETCPDSSASVASQVEAIELGEIVARLIDQLPTRQREVLIISTYESLTSEQIAVTLEMSVANVHANLSLARKKLKQQLGKYLSAQ